jgi:hypothetical protein
MTQYPQYPTDPNQPAGGPTYGGPAVRGPRPGPVDLAVKLIWTTIALSLVSALATFLLLDSIIDQQLESAGVSETISSDSVRSIAIAGAVFGLIISVGISSLLAIFIGKGANWARIVYTVLAVLAVLGTVFGFASQPVVLTVLSLISILLTIVAVVMLFRPESNAWFRAR